MESVPGAKLKIPDITFEDLVHSLASCPPSVNDSDMTKLQDFNKEFGHKSKPDQSHAENNRTEDKQITGRQAVTRTREVMEVSRSQDLVTPEKTIKRLVEGGNINEAFQTA